MIDLTFIGIILVLGLPGYFISKALFPALRHIDRVLLSVGLSIAIVAIIGLILGSAARWTPAIVWISLLSVTLVGFFIWRVRHAPRSRSYGTGRRRSGRNAGR